MAHVLIVDDSPTDIHAMRSALEEEGHEVSVSDSARDSLDVARETQPDVIIMDVVFQGMSGFQGTRKLARDPATSHIPIVIISGKDQETDRIWGLRQGASEYLVKPVHAAQLNRVVAGLLGTSASGA